MKYQVAGTAIAYEGQIVEALKGELAYVMCFAEVAHSNCELEIQHEHHVIGIRRVSVVITFMLLNTVLNIELWIVNIPHVMLRSAGAPW
jgi:hypothetical protein